MKGILPEKIRNRVDKTGYQTPQILWFKDPAFKEFFIDITNSDSFKSRIFLNSHSCQKAIKDYHKTGMYNLQFWKWLSLELWMKKYID
jgi:asparagine synthase (glutamine-hydrolysing)